MAYFSLLTKPNTVKVMGWLILYVFVYIYIHLPHPYLTVPAAALPSPLTGTDLLRHLSEALGYRLPGGGRTRK